MDRSQTSESQHVDHNIIENARNNVEPMVIDMAVEENDNTEDEPVIVESTSLDLETYANCYTGLAKLQRLVFIADRCPQLRVEALRMAIQYVQTTYNVNLYTQLHRKMQEAVSGANAGNASLPDIAGGQVGGGVVATLPVLDMQWVESRAKKAALKLEKLDTDLKNSKVNSIKESIRRGHDDLGDHYLDCGDLSNALKCYSRARDYCTSFRHIINMCLNVIKVSIYLNNWSHVLSYVSKAQATPEVSESRAAAKSFLGAQLDACDFPDLLSTSNVAISFKLFLEVEPQLRDIIFKFYESKYAFCLKLLDELKDVLMLDMYLAPHLNTLYTRIRNRALIQYFSPYMSADLEKMATAFNTTISALEDELMALILDGQIQARIDSHNKILYAKAVEERSMTFERSLEMGREHIMRVKGLILRSALIKNQIHVKSPPREGGGGGGQGSGDVTMAATNSSASAPRN
ncbi:COP9 signalosome complex subunit 1-like [Homarus americanus]|uniref:COP9 signalosome complex subunit 1-like n=1 Tax=Homarus americanus TaxID=6706 RepID=A0A8J5MLF7_HOMAM|nr:COP9 signalosome complex subunit 1-like [Homarus americanus]